MKAKTAVSKWKHKYPREYAKKLIDVLGEPDEITSKRLIWTGKGAKKAKAKRIMIVDESVKHEFPADHRDYVYTTKTMEVPHKLHSVFAYVTGSIIIDGLKKEVTARCGKLVANGVTLGFVEDVKKGKVSKEPKKAKKEYARRINAHDVPNWYKDVFGDEV